MKAFNFKLWLIAFCIAACVDHEQAPSLEGNYVGTFYRVRFGVKQETSNVNLTLSNNEYTGTSNMIKYPALCTGTFTETTTGINFTNTCMWTAEFDWTLILNGEFKISRRNGELILAKEINDENGDYYVLRRQ